MIGSSPALNRVRRAIAQVAPTDANVLVTGETGTGKELVAQAIHDQSPRRKQAFIPVSSVALAPGLITSELFGHELGAFTGAGKRRIGRFEQANGGTLFLDEIGEMPVEAQAMLLRVIQERVIERVGGDAMAVDVRIVAATNRDLFSEVKAGRFRADLYYRLHVFPIAVPPLRERLSDIPELVSHVTAFYCRKHGRGDKALSESGLKSLTAHDWPGNIRELQNIIERAVIVSEGENLVIDPSWFMGSSVEENARTWAEEEKARILHALKAAGGRIYGPGGAAHRLGLNPTTLYGKMRKHGLSKNDAQ